MAINDRSAFLQAKVKSMKGPRLEHCREMLGLPGVSGEFKHIVRDSVILFNFVKVWKLIMHNVLQYEW